MVPCPKLHSTAVVEVYRRLLSEASAESQETLATFISRRGRGGCPLARQKGPSRPAAGVAVSAVSNHYRRQQADIPESAGAASRLSSQPEQTSHHPGLPLRRGPKVPRGSARLSIQPVFKLSSLQVNLFCFCEFLSSQSCWFYSFSSRNSHLSTRHFASPHPLGTPSSSAHPVIVPSRTTQ